MIKGFVKLAIFGGVAYLLYKYFYSEKKESDVIYTPPVYDENDGKTTFYGDTKDEFVRGYILPQKITDIKYDTIDLLTKPKTKVFNLPPRSGFRAKIDRENKRILYFDFSANYDDVKDKLLMNNDYTQWIN